jgi:hypothetical protein
MTLITNPYGFADPRELRVPLPVVAGYPHPYSRVRVSAGKGAGDQKFGRGLPVPITNHMTGRTYSKL